MENFNLHSDVKVFGIQVKTFPNSIGEVFESLIKMFPKDDKRSYYGISEFKNGSMHYYATAEETFPGEGKKYNCDSLTIEKGEYLIKPLYDWRTKTDCIKDVFSELIQYPRVNKTKPAIEWYKNDDEMLCLVQTIASVK